MAALAPLPATGRARAAAAAVLFGGERDSGPLDDCWVAQLLPPGGGAPAAAGQQQRRSSSGGSGEATVRWLQLRVRGGPSPRFGHVIVGESRARCHTRCGGLCGQAPAACAVCGGAGTSRTACP
jgi:hypothetical protein